MSTRYQRTNTPYPMAWLNHREVGPFYDGPVFVWDIDKTYLNTRFSQLKGLMKIPLEFGIDKDAYPGVVSLLQGLREGPDRDGHRPLYFVSASPRQIASSIERKMLLDGIEYDGITFKDPLRLLFRGQFDQLKEQIAFKLSALLRLASEMPLRAQWHLFGDDAEQDALIYALFADASAGRLRGDDLLTTLVSLGVKREYARAIVARFNRLEPAERVAAIFIHLVQHPDGASITPFGPRVVGYASAGAVVRALVLRGLLGTRHAERVGLRAGSGDCVRGGALLDEHGWFTPKLHRGLS